MRCGALFYDLLSSIFFLHFFNVFLQKTKNKKHGNPAFYIFFIFPKKEKNRKNGKSAIFYFFFFGGEGGCLLLGQAVSQLAR